MALTPVPTIDPALPVPPNPADDEAVFDAKAYAWSEALPGFGSDIKAIGDATYTNALYAQEQAGLAESNGAAQVALATEQAEIATQASIVAAGAANYKGEYSADTTYLLGESVSYNGGRFVSKKTNLGITPVNGSDWLKLSSNEIIREARTSNVSLTVSDFGKLLDVTSGTFTQTFSAAATLGNGWFCYIKNSGTGDITLDPSGAELIDGLTSYVMYPGEVRLVLCDGTALRSVVLNAFYKIFTMSGTFTKPPGYSVFKGLLWGGGGSGGKAADSTSGGGGGGGGACVEIHVSVDVLTANESFVIAAGGGARTVRGVSGDVGGSSTFSFFTAYGGGGGGGSASPAAIAGGGGGGAFSPGLTATTANAVGGGGPYQGATYGSVNTGFGGAGSGGDSGFGGSGGGTGQPTGYDGSAGGKSIFGGAAGGGSAVAGRIAGSGGVSRCGGNGGAGGAGAGSGVDGTAPGGGGGGTCIGASSGAGARGELRIWGKI